MNHPADRYAAAHVNRYFASIPKAQQDQLREHFVAAYLEGSKAALQQMTAEIPSIVAQVASR